ncbi:RYR3 protein, partial [Upupa epops]|nr:RYR3 protein [Upupa epops]
TLKELISQTMVRWSQEDQIQDPELVRIMYTLLRRQYDSIGELLQALRKAYTISAASVKDTINLLAALGQIRSLLSVRMGKEEELLMINGLGYRTASTSSFLSLAVGKGSSSKAAQQQTPLKMPDRVRTILSFVSPAKLLRVHFVLSLMKILNTTGSSTNIWPMPLVIGTAVTVSYFHRKHCRASHLNRISLLTTICMSMLSLLIVVTYLAGCGLQSCPVLLAKGYPDIGWNPIEGERYLSFLRFAVFVN